MSVPNKYEGGKNGSGTYQQIINLIPEHKFYFELFVGSGAIYRNKLPAAISFLSDMDQKLIDSWINENIPGAIFQKMDAICFLETSIILINLLHDIAGKVFMYLDPPYPFFVRRSNSNIYKYELTNEQHQRLLIACSNAKFPVMISSYKNKMYDVLLRTWNTYQFKNQTRVGSVMECLYYNYPIPDRLHDYRYIGNTFRQRERFKLAQKNMISKFSRMPVIFRNAIIDELNTKFNEKA